jgi:CsoR family transcriptional regulator, copper-sensing transcriptional repressor
MNAVVSLPIYAEERQKELLDRLRRIEGQTRGLARMLEEQRPCLEVLQQLASACRPP